MAEHIARTPDKGKGPVPGEATKGGKVIGRENDPDKHTGAAVGIGKGQEPASPVDKPAGGKGY
jgi:hypothetical protein